MAKHSLVTLRISGVDPAMANEFVGTVAGYTETVAGDDAAGEWTLHAYNLQSGLLQYLIDEGFKIDGITITDGEEAVFSSWQMEEKLGALFTDLEHKRQSLKEAYKRIKGLEHENEMIRKAAEEKGTIAEEYARNVQSLRDQIAKMNRDAPTIEALVKANRFLEAQVLKYAEQIERIAIGKALGLAEALPITAADAILKIAEAVREIYQIGLNEGEDYG